MEKCNNCPISGRCPIVSSEDYAENHYPELRSIVEKNTGAIREIEEAFTTCHPLISLAIVSSDDAKTALTACLGMIFKLGFYLGRTHKQSEVPDSFKKALGE